MKENRRSSSILPVSHAIASTATSLIIYWHFRSLPCALISWITGFFLDIDHVVDYYANHDFTLSYKDIYRASVETNYKKIYLVLHSDELVLAVWGCIVIFSPGIFWTSAAIGFTQHMLFDHITNPVKQPLGYFLLYRIRKHFDTDSLVNKAELEKRRMSLRFP